ncbi:hypothetical protein AMJ71_00335 [candidate division TA06 bacterium SM1_40]|uniref:histidine kinase n=2 Tax=Bacteria division TA06 TaxID=1156500 RepID=A0A0S8JQV4_UNCT6|nr:MAG: hypothetical protein AMJ82_00275 [candidate division TA06 bacterium SM23_40]KPL11571.1 MAG: hypothetical protein AMJ71_00335 [candidate division TA06 bacterium SM1_40]
MDQAQMGTPPEWMSGGLRQGRGEEGRLLGRTGPTDASLDIRDVRFHTPLWERVIGEAPVAIIALDPTRKILVSNPAAQRLVGRSSGELIGRDILDVWPEAGIEDILDLVEAALTGETTVSIRARPHRMPGGETGFLDLACSILRGHDGVAEGMVIIANEITEAVRHDEQESRKQVLESIGRLAGKAAHKIGNPLGAITACSSSLLSSSGWISGSDRELLEIIVEESRRLGKIVSDFLSLNTSRELHLEQVNVCRLLDYVIRTLERNRSFGGRDSKIVVRKSYDEALPSILGDPARLGEALRNVILNAVEAMPDGGPVRVSVGMAREDGVPTDSVSIKVVDEGVGIPAEDVPCVTMPFFSTKPDRIGLGLAIAWEIVGTHGGTLTVASELGRGTCVEVVLPRAM